MSAKKKIIQRKRQHAKIRALQRYGLNYNQKTRKEMTKMIRSGKLKTKRKLTNTKSKYIVEYRDKKYHVIYSHKHNEILTFLLPHHLIY